MNSDLNQGFGEGQDLPGAEGGSALVVGIDAGGTRTRAVLAAAADGRVVGEGAGGPGNALTVPRDRLTANLAEAVGRAVPEGVRGRVVAVAGGFAGANGASEDEPGRLNALTALRAALRQLGIPTGALGVSSDIEAAFASAPGAPADGLALVAGTGAVAMRIADRGATTTVDGDGWLLGDDGSGFWIGREAVRAALRMADGRGGPTLLAEAVGRALALPEEVLPPTNPQHDESHAGSGAGDPSADGSAASGVGGSRGGGSALGAGEASDRGSAASRAGDPADGTSAASAVGGSSGGSSASGTGEASADGSAASGAGGSSGRGSALGAGEASDRGPAASGAGDPADGLGAASGVGGSSGGVSASGVGGSAGGGAMVSGARGASCRGPVASGWSRERREAYRRYLLPVVMADVPIRLARFAPLVAEAAQGEDVVAGAILERAADHLAVAVRALEPRSGERVVATGGLLGPDGPLTGPLAARLQPLGLTLDWVADGCIGAVSLARLLV
ncbi:BadF/BadG/BcrA/BcrD ATPase family protein [Streptomyces sp. NPDC057257]|uniref:BadF/BadG/BcrA/BcrD ATPase family protein n=1 Tax=Streptomyces sp. NPDC057257 TaxID=3346071 RepID=UPI0036262177